MVPSFDPELKLIYIGTSVTSPAPKFWLAGNDKTYLYHNCTLALSLETGKIVWYYQHIVDHWDFDHPFERLLIDTEVTPDPTQVSWINPRLKPGERSQSGDGYSRQNRNRIHTGPQNGRISVGHSNGASERGDQDRWRNRRRHGKSRDRIQQNRR